MTNPEYKAFKLQKAFEWLWSKCGTHYSNVCVTRDAKQQFVATIFYFHVDGKRKWYCVDTNKGKPTRVKRICI